MELVILKCKMFKTDHGHSAVASMGQGGSCPPPNPGLCPPNGSCPGHSLKPEFGIGAIEFWELY